MMRMDPKTRKGEWARVFAVTTLALTVIGQAGAQDPVWPGAPLTYPVLTSEEPADDHRGAAKLFDYGERTRKPDDPSDLTLWNFFSAGWNDDYTRRSFEDRAPDRP